MSYKLSSHLKWTFTFNVGLFITSLFTGNDVVMAASVVIFVVLSSTSEILEAISNNNS